METFFLQLVLDPLQESLDTVFLVGAACRLLMVLLMRVSDKGIHR
jgi:hypothetical protein